MNLHSDIMNIPVNLQTISSEVGNPRDYKLGHRDARHAAAELSLKAEARIEELEAEVLRLKTACHKEFADVEFLSNRSQLLSDILSQVLYSITPVSNTAYNLGQSHEQWDSIRQSVSELDSLRTKAYKVLKGDKS